MGEKLLRRVNPAGMLKLTINKPRDEENEEIWCTSSFEVIDHGSMSDEKDGYEIRCK